MKTLNYIFDVGAILSPKQLEHKVLDEYEFHYYMIVTCKKHYIYDVFEKNDTICFILYDGQNKEEVLLPIPVNYKVDNVSFEYTDFSRMSTKVKYTLIYPDGKKENRNDEFSGSGVYFYCIKVKEYRIEYIGQSYANNGHRTAQERLSNHSTLQKIMIDYDHSDREVLLVLLAASICPMNNELLTGSPSCFVLVDDIDGPKYVNLLEACLINQFKPKYNVIYKEGMVPSTKHTTYDEVINEKYDSFSINVAIMNCPRNYEFYTDTKRVRVNEGVLTENDRLYMSFKDATTINSDEFMYSFLHYDEQ